MQPNTTFLVTTYEKENKKGILCAVLENGHPIELALEPAENPSLLGNIYIGKVKNLAPQIGAAFIEIAEGQICYYAIQENPAPIIVNRRHTDAKKPLVEGDELIVQVSREALKTKVPAVTSNLNFPGKYLVLTSGENRLGISGKLPEEERERLKALLTPLWDGSFGLIARTNAAGVEEAVLKEELQRLKTAYETVLEKGRTRTCFTKLSQEEPDFVNLLKGIPKEALTEIVTDNRELYETLHNYLREFQPEDLPKLRLYEDRLLPLSKLYSLEKALEEAVRERVWLKSGGYLVIQPTEALTVVDVNTGKYEGGKKKQNTFWKINREAAIETARQLRLRNLSGIVIVDFIDMESQEDKDALMELLRTELRKDPVKAAVIDMTKLNLVEITRKKVRKSLAEQLLALQ